MNQEKKGQKIRVKAVGFGIGFAELSDLELAEFLAEIEEVDNAIEIKAVSNLTDSSFYEYGFLLDEECIWLEVDDQDADEDIEVLLDTTNPNIVDLSSSENAHWLVYEATEEIDCTVIVEKYDPRKFELSKTVIKLPNGEVKTIASLYYAGEGFDTCDTTSQGRVYVLKKDGQIINF